jgi:hypothetical protein
MLKIVEIYPTSPVFPMASSVWNFPDPHSFDNVAVAIIEEHRKLIENNRLITSNVVYRKVL